MREARKRETPAQLCAYDACKNKLGEKNKTGYCWQHYRLAASYKKNKSYHDGLIKAAVDEIHFNRRRRGEE
jgi:hypothetical protein